MLMVVDRRSGGPWMPAYMLSALCHNCAVEHVALLNKGEPPAPANERCPHCLVVGRLAYSNSVRAGVLVQNAQTYQCLWEMADGFMPFGMAELVPLAPEAFAAPRD